MARIIWTDDRENLPVQGNLGYWTYNGLDCCITSEVFDNLFPQLDEDTKVVYDFERKLQNPVLEMNGRGILVDRTYRDIMVGELRKEQERLDNIIQQFAHAVWDQPLNPASPVQLHKFFFGAMQVPEFRVSVGRGVWKVATNREALEKMAVYLYPRPIVNAILAYRDRTKQIQTLTTGIDKDSRFRTSYNIAGTETGRWSSSENAFGTGGNTQNITGELRRVFVADKGMKLAYLDLEQAESRAVALLAFLCSGQDTYLRACESGDLHTVVSKLCWPNLPWPGDQDGDKAVAESPFYRQFSYRDLAKRGGHGTNYYGKAPTIAKNLRIEVPVAEQFQNSYFRAFPEIKLWHEHTARTLVQQGHLTTPLRRRRYFFDRLDDDATLRKAIAFVPQSMIADMLNDSLYQIWENLKEVQVLLQVHDAVVVQYPEKLENEIIPKILRYMRKEYVFEGRSFSIGSEAQTGWNWAKYTSEEDVLKAKAKGKKVRLNLDGMRKFKTSDSRKRKELPNSIEAMLSAIR